MKFDYPHPLSLEEARARMQALTDYLTRRHGLAVSWSGDRGTVRGKVMGMVGIDGEFLLAAGNVHVEAKDPGFLWRKKAVDYLKKKFGQYLDPARPLAELDRG
jgi:hypothetical protein